MTLETRDACDGHLTPRSTVADLASLPVGAIHPLTGPVSVKGARPGDLLEIEFREIAPQPWAFSAHHPGPRLPPRRHDDAVPRPLDHRRRLGDLAPAAAASAFRARPSWACPAWRPRGPRSRRGPAARPTSRRAAGWRCRPDAGGAVPARGAAATHGLRTLPPRENGGNFDVKQLTRGLAALPARGRGRRPLLDGRRPLRPGRRRGLRDGGRDGRDVRRCASASTKGEAARRGIRWPRFAHGDYFTDPRWAAPRHFVATMGMPVDAQGVNHGEDLNLACRNALLAMLDLLRGARASAASRPTSSRAWRSTSGSATSWTSRTYVVSALLPEDIFQG